MLKAGDSICVEMVSAHKERAEVVALLCCCLRYLKIREYRPYPSVQVLVWVPGFARENKKIFLVFVMSIRPFDPPTQPPPLEDFVSLSRSRDLRWRLNSRSLRHNYFNLKWFRFRNSLLWSIFAPWRKHHATCRSYLSVSARSFLLHLTCIQFLRKEKIFIAFTCFAQSTIITKPFSKLRVSHSDDTRWQLL